MARAFHWQLSTLIYSLISCSCGGLLFFTNPVLAWQSVGRTSLSSLLSPSPSSSSSSLFARRRNAAKHKPLRKYIAAATGISTTASLLSPTVWAVQEDYRPLETMIANNNAVALATGVSAIAAITSVLSWRKMQRVQNELNLLREEKFTVTKETQDSIESKICDNNWDTASKDVLLMSDQQEPNGEKRDQQHGNKHHHHKKKHHQHKKKQTGKQEQEQNDLAVMRIGVIRSIYRLCVGTPRQGLLAPDARGRIELDKIGNSSTAATVSGLEEFSYIWILFHFHLNTQSTKKERRFKSKISPPALGGKKVGIYATRSPHRHNPIGITLCKLDRIQVHGPHKVTLHVSGLDLVDGTPVLDIKPYVPVYDSVNAFTQASISPLSPETSTETITSPSPTLNLSSDLAATAEDLRLPPPRVPKWVEGGLATKRSVVITESAKNELEELLRLDAKALEFYGPHCYCDNDGTGDNTIDTILRVIEQVLSIDVRSSHQTRKARTGRSQAERAVRVRSRFDIESSTASNNDSTEIKEEEMKIATQYIAEELSETKTCTQQLDNLLIYFTVKEVEAKRHSSKGSGAEDGIIVESIKLLPTTKRGEKAHK